MLGCAPPFSIDEGETFRINGIIRTVPSFVAFGFKIYLNSSFIRLQNHCSVIILLIQFIDYTVTDYKCQYVKSLKSSCHVLT